MKANEYKCGVCKGVFEKGWSDGLALKEAAEIWGKPVGEWDEGPGTVCDDCFIKVKPVKYD